VSALEIGLHGEHLFPRRNRLEVLETLGRAPQDPRLRQVRLGQRRVQHKSPATVVFGLLEQGAARVEFKVHVHRDDGQPRVRRRPFRITRDRLRQALDGAPNRLWSISVALAETGHEVVIRFRIVMQNRVECLCR
jgi:hypothetical protein